MAHKPLHKPNQHPGTCGWPTLPSLGKPAGLHISSNHRAPRVCKITALFCCVLKLLGNYVEYFWGPGIGHLSKIMIMIPSLEIANVLHTFKFQTSGPTPKFV